jgi:hypothetical protein
MRLSDGSVLLNSQNPAGGGSLIETPPTVVSTANALDVATTNPRPRRIELPNFSTNVCIVTSPSRLRFGAPEPHTWTILMPA